MCRSLKCGDKKDKRCPSHRDPSRKLLASALQRLCRWERHIVAAEAAGDAAAAEHAVERVIAAVEDINIRSGAQTAHDAQMADIGVPAPEPLDAFTLTQVDGDDLERLWGERAADPAGQELIEREWARRDARARQSEIDRADFPFTSYETLVDQLHEPEALTDAQLREAWLDAHPDPALRELAEAEMDRRLLVRAAHPHDDEALAGAVEDRIDWAYANMSPSQFRRYEATVITDPAERVAGRRVRTKISERELRQDYHEYSFERYLAAEDYCRGYMLNARGAALKVDPFSLFSGTANRVQAYGSEELLGFLSAHGGHISYARYKHVHTTGRDYKAENIERFSDAVYVSQ